MSRKQVFVGLLLILFVSSFYQAQIIYFAGLILALIYLWSLKWNWVEFGLQKFNFSQTFLKAISYSIILFILVDFLITPVVEAVYGNTNYESFDSLRGNLANTLICILMMWIVAAIVEEFVFRGFFMKHLARLFGNTQQAWIIGAVISSILFGLAHQYQGTAGVIQTGIVGMLLSYLFFKNQNNLVLGMLVHGMYNTIGLFLIYLNSERVITDYISNL